MSAGELEAALTREHREVDTAVEAFVEGLRRGEVDEPGLRLAFNALRRHIYLEEELAFPPMRRAGLVMPVLVMLREHGELWRAMDAVEAVLADASDGCRPADLQDRLAAACRDLLVRLDRHNTKEEPVVYPHLGSDLDSAAKEQLAEFLRTGGTPQGWTCQHAAG